MYKRQDSAASRRSVRARVLPWLLVVLLLAAAAGLWWWRAHDSAGSADQAAAARRFGGAGTAQPVSVAPVRRQDIHVSIDAIGSVGASNTAEVRAQVSGVLQSLHFKEGQQVKAGQLLAQIDPRAFQAALSQAEGMLARDKAQLAGARVDLARYTELLAKDAIPKQQLDTQRALVQQLEGTVAADQGTVASARLQLAHTRVIAPISGRTGLKQADLGNMVTPGDANGIVSITQTRPVALVFAVPADHVAQIAASLRADRSLPVQAWDSSGQHRLAQGRVETIDNAIDPATDTIKVKALFDNTDDSLFPNQAVSVRLQLSTVHDALAVPRAAVLRGAQGFYVYVVGADGTVSARSVTPGPVDGDAMAVQGKLQAGEQVVIDGTDRLREGARVEVIATDPAQRVGASAPAGMPRRGASAASAAASAARNGARAAGQAQ